MPAKLKNPTATSVRNKIRTLHRKLGELATEALEVGLGGDAGSEFHQAMKAAESSVAAALTNTATKGRGKAPLKRLSPAKPLEVGDAVQLTKEQLTNDSYKVLTPGQLTGWTITGWHNNTAIVAVPAMDSQPAYVPRRHLERVPA